MAGEETSQSAPRGTQTLRRGLDVVQAVADGARDLTGIAEATGLSRSTAHRLVQGLLAERLLAETRPGDYRLGGRLLAWGGAASAQNPLTVAATGVLEQLARTVQDTVHLACEDAGTVFYLHKIDGSRGASMRSRVGGREPLLRTGVGKALLLDAPERWEALARADGTADPAAVLARMREYAVRGVARDLEENEPGIRCVAAPVRDARGAIIGAVSVSATSPYMPPERLDPLGEQVREAAVRIGAALGAR